MQRGSATTDDKFAYFTPVDSNIVYRYEWNTMKWEPLPPSHCRNSGLVIINNSLTTVGGEYGSHATDKLYTLRQHQWVEHYPPMNTACFSPAIVSDSDYIFVIAEGDCWTTTVEAFHVKNEIWCELAYQPQALTRPSATICGNQLHLMGINGKGQSCSLQALRSSTPPKVSQPIFNIRWKPLPDLPVKNSTAATLCGQLVMVGGKRDGIPVNSIYQLVGGRWEEIGSMCSERSECLVVSRTPDKTMIVGGDERSGNISVEDCTCGNDCT